MRTYNETENTLAYKIQVGIFGYVNGSWQYISGNKTPLFTINIEITPAEELEKDYDLNRLDLVYKNSLATMNPLETWY